MLTDSLAGIVRTYVPFFRTRKPSRSVFDIPEGERFVLTEQFAEELIESGQPEDMTMSHVGQEMAFFPRKIGKSTVHVLWEVSKK